MADAGSQQAHGTILVEIDRSENPPASLHERRRGRLATDGFGLFRVRGDGWLFRWLLGRTLFLL
jgi:hypothetical protein